MACDSAGVADPFRPRLDLNSTSLQGRVARNDPDWLGLLLRGLHHVRNGPRHQRSAGRHGRVSSPLSAFQPGLGTYLVPFSVPAARGLCRGFRHMYHVIWEADRETNSVLTRAFASLPVFDQALFGPDSQPRCASVFSAPAQYLMRFDRHEP